jgi:hypothetical protein
MDRRVLHTQRDVEVWCAFLKKATLPMVVGWKKGDEEITRQNRTAFMWYAEISAELGDQTPTEVRAYCKLHLGVPIRREVDEDFRAEYDQIVRPLPYEHKLKLMVEPFDFPVTREFTVPQMTRYLDAIQREFAHVRLTMPEAA